MIDGSSRGCAYREARFEVQEDLARSQVRSQWVFIHSFRVVLVEQSAGMAGLG